MRGHRLRFHSVSSIDKLVLPLSRCCYYLESHSFFEAVLFRSPRSYARPLSPCYYWIFYAFYSGKLDRVPTSVHRRRRRWYIIKIIVEIGLSDKTISRKRFRLISFWHREMYQLICCTPAEIQSQIALMVALAIQRVQYMPEGGGGRKWEKYGLVLLAFNEKIIHRVVQCHFTVVNKLKAKVDLLPIFMQ